MSRDIQDAEILSRSLAEPAAFADLYERHHDRVIAYVARRVGMAAAEDLAAEVFVRAFRGRDRCRCEHGSALPWLLGVVNHVVADHRRVEKRRLAAITELCGQPSHSVEAEDMWLSADLAEALRNLPGDDRDALLLVVWGELSYEEAATA